MSTKFEGVRQITRRVSRDVSRRSPTILTVMAVGGLVGTVVLAVRATPKALYILDSERIRDLNNPPIDLKPFDYIRLTWREYLPAFLMGTATITCIIGANSIHWQRTAAMQGLYSLTDVAFKEYQAKVVETLGQRKEEKIREAVIQDKIEANPASKNVIFMTGRGDMLCYDALSGRYFKSDIESIRRIQNEVNHNLMIEMWISLNELYSEMGLEGIDLGEKIGWDPDELIDFVFTSKLTDTGEPCLVLTHRVMPILEAQVRGL